MKNVWNSFRAKITIMFCFDHFFPFHYTQCVNFDTGRNYVSLMMNYLTLIKLQSVCYPRGLKVGKNRTKEDQMNGFRYLTCNSAVEGLSRRN